MFLGSRWKEIGGRKPYETVERKRQKYRHTKRAGPVSKERASWSIGCLTVLNCSRFTKNKVQKCTTEVISNLNKRAFKEVL